MSRRSRDESTRSTTSRADGAASSPRLRDLGAWLPVSRELGTGLIDIALAPPPDSAGEARIAELEMIAWPQVDPSPALIQRLRAIPESRPTRRSIGRRLWSGPWVAAAASYLLAAALTLAVGDPVTAGSRATSQLRESASQHLIEPATQAGASLRTRISGGLESLHGLWNPAALLGEAPSLPTGRVRDWFQTALDSSSEALRGLGSLLPGAAADDPNQPADTPTNAQPTRSGRMTA